MEWAETHLIPPSKQFFSVDLDSDCRKGLWLVTDHNGTNDSSYRIVFDDEMQMFGLETTMQDETAWYMGPYGSFQETVENM